MKTINFDDTHIRLSAIQTVAVRKMTPENHRAMVTFTTSQMVFSKVFNSDDEAVEYCKMIVNRMENED